MSSAKRGYDASGRRADAQARRDRVVEVAAALFLERGYSATAIGDIAAAAGVSAPFVYAAFDSKAGILARAVDVAVAGDTSDLSFAERPATQAAYTAADVPARLAATVRLLSGSHERAARLIDIVESARATDPALAALARALDDGLRTDVLAFLRALPRRALRADATDLEHVADAIAALASARTWNALVEVRGWTPEEYEQFVITTIERLYLR